MEQFLQEAVEAKRVMATLDGATRNNILMQMANGLESKAAYIIEKNNIDMEDGERNNLTSALMDRLLLNEDRIKGMAKALRKIAALKDPVNKILEG
ncbi:MAG TPA: gamma-glutamyl-phosphate reductase, partial [Arcobacter sp.]|nr:gamma-glutamyl-phosphate reductase [Arcobacter sp.]